MGDTEDLILRLYTAYRRQDIDDLMSGMHPEVRFKPVPGAREYVGRDDLRLFFEHEIHDLAEFDFRVITVQEEGDRALLHGRNRIRGETELRDAPIYWVSTVRDGMMFTFAPYADHEEALAAFRGETGPG